VPFEKNRVDVAFEMVHAHQRLAEGLRESFSVSDSNEEGADESGAVSDADGVQIAQLHSCLDQGFPHDRNDLPQVLARGQFRDYAAVLPVYVDLRSDHAGQDFAAVDDYRGGGLVAGRFDS
jgi:hypothetical protein